ncbi:hypothetical protein [Actinophytocola sp.]|uniref:hypothetical protein n=1 Tax=Actinophytocola sp. TaxID=1872138 RepID=UPI003D6AE405
MALDPRSIPDATTPPPDPARSGVRKTIKRTHFSRRGVLRSMLGAGMVVGIASLDLLPTGRKAAAAPPTWRSCDAYPQYPSWAKNCNANGAGQHVSIGYCGSTGYHRRDSTSAGCRFIDYTRARRCLGKNAWVWRKDRVDPEYRNKRCSDGWVYVTECSGQTHRYKSTCLKYL